MLSINFGDSTDSNCIKHYDEIKSWLIDRIDKQNIKKNLKDQLKSDLKTFITGEPDDLQKINRKYLKIFPKKRITNAEGKLKYVNDSKILSIFNYKEFRRKFGFILSNNLRVACCPYCNKNHTSTLMVKTLNNKKVFPEFDHFFSQSTYPFLTLSFYNLIPSCNVCNTHFKSFSDSTKLFHPYSKVGANHFNFKNLPNDIASLYGTGKNIELEFEYNSSILINDKVKASIKFFGIKEIYEQCHTELIQNIIHKKIAFSDRYIKELQNTYKLSFEDAYEILFEAHYDDKQLHNRPFSKLKRDIYDDVRIKSM